MVVIESFRLFQQAEQSRTHERQICVSVFQISKNLLNIQGCVFGVYGGFIWMGLDITSGVMPITAQGPPFGPLEPP